MDTVAFLRESNEVNNKRWRNFSQRFFEEYRDTIMEYYGYANRKHYTPPREVKEPHFFVAVMKVLFDSGMFGCNRRELADTLDEGFDLGIKSSTIRRWLYEMFPKYEGNLSSFKGIIPTQINEK